MKDVRQRLEDLEHRQGRGQQRQNLIRAVEEVGAIIDAHIQWYNSPEGQRAQQAEIERLLKARGC